MYSGSFLRRFFLILLSKPRKNSVAVFDELTKSAGNNHRVNCPIEFPIFARLEAPGKIHQLSQLQISVFIANYLGEFIYLLNGEFGFATGEFSKIPQLNCCPGLGGAIGERLAHKPQRRCFAKIGPALIQSVVNLLSWIEYAE